MFLDIFYNIVLDMNLDIILNPVYNDKYVQMHSISIIHYITI